MKKLLALVLALVMTLSLCVVSSNAAYTDAADVDYKEAVDVMSAIGVLQGSDGKFNPDGILTREQAAKIVTYMLLGKKAADALVTIAAPFADVAADRWSAGSIAYCYNEGILAGVGNGMFAPTAELTGLAFAKMMLTALGYDAEQEGLTGSNWSINVAKMALSLKLTDGMEEVVLSQPMSRQQAAQMALNVLETMCVYYENNSTITAGNVTIKTNTTAKDDPDGLFYQKYWSKLTVNHGDSTDFKAPATTWSYKNEEIGTYAKSAKATLENGVTYGDLYTAIGSNAVKKINDVDIYVDGVLTAAHGTNKATNKAFDAANIEKGSTDDFGYDATWAAGAIADDTDLTGNGTKTEVYVTEITSGGNAGKYNVTIVVVNTYIAKVSSITAATASADRKINFTRMGNHAAPVAYKTEDFAKNDVVLYTAVTKTAGWTVETIEKVTATDPVEVTSVKNDGTSFVADGTTYKFSSDFSGSVSLGNSYNLYLDNAGYVIAVDLYNDAADYANYLVVTDDEITASLGSAKVSANAVTLDGQKLSGIVLGKLGDDKLNANHLGKNAAGASVVSPKNIALDTVYSFTVDTNGKYNLKAVAAPYATAVLTINTDQAGSGFKFHAGATQVGTGVVANADTKFVVYNNNTDKVNVYEGIANMMNIANSATVNGNVLTKSDATGVAKVVYVETNAAASNASTAKDIVYLLDAKYDTSKDADHNYATYNVVKDGVATTITLKDDTISPGTVGLYYISQYDGEYVDAIAAATPGTPSDFTYATVTGYVADYTAGVLTINGNGYVCNDKTAVYSVSDKGVMTPSAVENLTSDDTTLTYYIVVKTTDGVATVQSIFVQE